MSDLSGRAIDVLSARLAAGDGARRRGLGGPDETFAAVTSKRWRRSALTQYSADDIRSKIRLALDEERALTFTVPCGGYKSWRLASSPLPNWAEVFFVSHLRSFVRHVGQIFPYGVRAELTYVAGVMDLVSNHQPQWQSTYVEAMRSLLKHHSDDEDNLSIVDIASLPGVANVREEVLESYARIRSEWVEPLTQVQLAKLRSAERNFAPDGAQQVSVKELPGRIFESAVLCDALDALEVRRRYNKFGPRIQLVFGRQPQPALHIGTCETSTTHFWVSEGVLERHGSMLLPRMIGHTSVLARPGLRVETGHLAEMSRGIGPWVPTWCEVI